MMDRYYYLKDNRGYVKSIISKNDVLEMTSEIKIFYTEHKEDALVFNKNRLDLALTYVVMRVEVSE